MKTSCFLLLLAATVHAATLPALGPIVELGAGITPGICSGADGTLHVVFMDADRISYQRSTDGVRFSSDGDIPSPPGKANPNSPHLVSDGRGVLHLVFGHNSAGNARRAWYTNRVDGSWRAPLLVLERTEPGRRVNYPRLAVAGDQAYVGAFTAGGSTVAHLAGLPHTPHIAGSVESPLWVAHPFVSTDQALAIVGRRGASGHHRQNFSAALEPRGGPLLLSRGTPTKSFEPFGATQDARGVIHLVGAAGSPVQVLWYTTSARAERQEPVLLGPELGHDVKEYSYPNVLVDPATHRVFISYRKHPSGEGNLTVLEPGATTFSAPVTFAPAITQRLRWNAPIALGRDGSVVAVWDHGGQAFARRISFSRSRAE